MLPRRALTPRALALLLVLAAACGRSQPGPTAARPKPAARGLPVAGTQSVGTLDPVGGGTLVSDDGLVTVFVPAGAVTTATQLTIQEVTPNTAPGAVGKAYRITTATGVPPAAPVSITFDASAAVSAGTSLDALNVSFQENDGWWLRFGSLTKDATARTVTIQTTHFSDWSLVTRDARDLRGTFSIDSTRWTHPVHITGDATFTWAGQDSIANYYLQTGTLTLTSPIVDGPVTCTIDTAQSAATQPIATNIAELLASEFRWGISGNWAVTCNASSDYVQLVFDTMGVNNGGCAVTPGGTQTLTSAEIAGTSTMTCAVGGGTTATWDFKACNAGVACTPTAGGVPNTCQTGAITCDTGYEVCSVTGNVTNGTSCGADMACTDGACTCVPGVNAATCPAQDACHTAAITCANNTPTCTQTAKTDGTSCGTDLTCQAGACACQPGPSPTCIAQDTCHTAAIDCTTGSPVCAQTPVTDGTSCGADMTCQAGACTCVPGPDPVTCPPDACNTAAIQCGTNNLPTCVKTPVTNGTSCGTDLTCQNGTCGCQPGPSPTCVAQDACHTAAIDCSSGSPVCAQTALTGNSCGTDMLCQAGACTCVEGPSASCAAQDTCHSAAITCTNNTPSCTQTPLTGNTCGTDMLCQAGACTCVEGPSASCVAQDTCHTAAITCPSNSPTCTQTPLTGNSCGTDMLCQAGACTCQPGSSASCPPTNECWDAAIVCSNNAPSCTQTMKANGTACGTGSQSCSAGSCVASRTVTGSRRVSAWPEASAVVTTAVDVGATVEARVADGNGGFVVYSGTVAADGSFSIPSVPTGPYWLVFVGADNVAQVLDASADAVDLGYDVLGRADVVAAADGTWVDFVATGVSAGDLLEATSANADIHVSASASAVPPTPTTVDWATSASGGRANLLGAADTLYVHALTPQAAVSTVTGGNFDYRATGGWASVSGTVMDPGVMTTVAVTLATAASSGTLAVNWSATQFEALLPGFGPSIDSVTATSVAADTVPHTLRVGASAFPLTNPAPVAVGAPTLLSASLAMGSADVETVSSLSYGRFLDPALWSEWREVGYTAHVVYTAPGATTSLDEIAGVIQRQDVATAPSPIVPALGPVGAPLVGGANALEPLTLGTTTPTIWWSAPTTGTPTRYTVTIYRLAASPLGATTAPRVATFTTAATQITVLPGLLVAGQPYFARIEASTIPNDGAAAAPFRTAGTWARASTLTAVFTP